MLEIIAIFCNSYKEEKKYNNEIKLCQAEFHKMTIVYQQWNIFAFIRISPLKYLSIQMQCKQDQHPKTV